MTNAFFNRWRICFLLVCVISALVYLPALGGQKIWDDFSLIDGTGIGGGESFLKAITEPFLGAYFRPLVSVSFVLENRLSHGIPFFYHQTNILLHVAATALLIGLLLEMFRSRRLALLGGLLFAVQPAQVSTVAWIGGRTDSLCSVLVLLFALWLIKGIRAETGRKKLIFLCLSVLSFFCALVTKEQILAMLPLVPLALRAFGKGNFDFKSAARLTVPYAIVSFVFACLWLALYPNPFRPMFRGPVDQVVTAGHAGSYYSLLLLTPAPRWMHTLSLGWFEMQGVISALLGLAAIALLAWACVRTHKKNPAVGWLFAFVGLALAPVLNLVPLPSLLVAPYRAGVPGIGIAALLAVGLWSLGSQYRKLSVPLAVAYAAACAALTFWGATRWADPITFFGTVAQYDPASIIARRNLSSSLLRAGEAKEAEARMTEALTYIYGGDRWADPEAAYKAFKSDRDVRLRVKNNQGNLVEPEDWLGELYGQLAYARAEQHNYEGSKVALEIGKRVDPKNCGVRTALAQYAFHDQDYKSAYRHLSIAVAVRPKEPKILMMLGQAYAGCGKPHLAEVWLEKSIKLQPWFGPTYLDLADLLMQEGRVEDAREALNRAKDCKVQDKQGYEERVRALNALLEKRGMEPLPT